MAFEGLSEKLSAAFKKLRGKGRLSENDVKGRPCVKSGWPFGSRRELQGRQDFVSTVTEKCIGSDVLDSLTPAQQVIKIVNDELTALMGGTNAKLTMASPVSHCCNDGGPAGCR